MQINLTAASQQQAHSSAYGFIGSSNRAGLHIVYEAVNEVRPCGNTNVSSFRSGARSRRPLRNTNVSCSIDESMTNKPVVSQPVHRGRTHKTVWIHVCSYTHQLALNARHDLCAVGLQMQASADNQ